MTATLRTIIANGDKAAREAYELANTLILKQLTSKVQQSPSVDVSEWLMQQTKLYPTLRRRLAEAASKSSARITPQDQETTSSSNKTHTLLIQGAVEVVSPLLDDVVGLASSAHPGAGLLDEPLTLEASLNRAMEHSQVLWALHGTVVMTIGESGVVKISNSLDPDGITNLEYINTKVPNIPTPKSLGALRSGGRTYAFMSRAEGVSLDTIWGQLSTTQKRSIQSQLNGIFGALRTKVPEDSPNIGSFVSGTCKDMRRDFRASERPIRSEADLNDFLCTEPGRTQTVRIRMARSSMREDHRLVMTHGDLHPRNIMVKGFQGEEEGDVRITSLIDWETGGWYPEHWEFIKAMSGADPRGPLADWCEYLPTEAIGTWTIEYSLDHIISRWLG